MAENEIGKDLLREGTEMNSELIVRNESQDEKCCQKERVKCLIWDLDGTLSNSTQLGFDATNHILQLHNYSSITPKEYSYGTRFPTKERLLYHIRNHQDESGEMLPTVTPNHKDGEEEEDEENLGIKLENEFNCYYIQLANDINTKLFSGVLPILEQFSSTTKMSILSNASTNYVNKVLHVNHIQQFFHSAYGIEDVPAGKPSPSGLEKIINELQCEKSDCIYIGDSITDGQAAKACNIYSIGVTWGSSSLEILQDNFSIIVTTPEELVQAIDKYFSLSKRASRRKSRSKSVSWQEGVIDNEGMGKFRTDDEYWDPSVR